MAEQRRGSQDINENELKRYRKMYESEFFQTIRMLPKRQKIAKIKEAIPEISSKQIDEILKYWAKQQIEDPFALLQEDVFKEGGQLVVSSMTPNFEMSLYIAQVTGSIMLTDSPTRWGEINRAYSKGVVPVHNSILDLQTFINSSKFEFCANSETSFRRCFDKDFGRVKSVFQKMYRQVRNGHGAIDPNLMISLRNELIEGNNTILEMESNPDDYCFTAKMSCSIPPGGFVNNNVQRLLLKSGSENHLDNVPMAIYLEQ